MTATPIPLRHRRPDHDNNDHHDYHITNDHRDNYIFYGVPFNYCENYDET